VKEIHFHRPHLEFYLRLGRQARSHSIELKKYVVTGANSLPSVERALRRRLRGKLRQMRGSPV